MTAALEVEPFVRVGVTLSPPKPGGEAPIVAWNLAAHIPVALVLAEFVPMLHAKILESGRDGSWLESSRAAWRLATADGSTLDNAKTLANQGVVDGNQVFLVRRHFDERNEPLFDDVAEMLAHHMQKTFPMWDKRAARALMSALVPIVSVFVSIAALVGLGDASFYARAVSVGVLCAVAIVCCGFARATGREEALAGVSRALVATTLVFVAAAAAAAVPRPLGGAQTVCAAAAVLVAAVALRVAEFKEHAVLGGAICGSALIAAVGGSTLSPGLGGADRCAIMLVSGYYLTLVASALGRRFGGVRLPHVPAEGETPTTSRRSGAVAAGKDITAQRDRALVTHANSVGILFGALSICLACSFGVGFFPPRHPVIALLAVGSIALSLAYQGKSLVGRLEQGACLASSALLPWFFSAGFAVSHPAPGSRWIGAAAVCSAIAGFVVALLVTIRDDQVLSPAVSRSFEFVEVAIVFASPLYIYFLLDGFSRIRGL